MTESSEYKNGYIICADQVIRYIDAVMNQSYDATESIASVLLKLKKEILEECFK